MTAHEASREEEAALLDFMAKFEPVRAQGIPKQVAEYQCRCGRPVARAAALCIRCGNTSWLSEGHAERSDVRRADGRRK